MTAGYCSSASPRTGLVLIPVTPTQVKRLFKHHRQPELATAFDWVGPIEPKLGIRPRV
jgi:hypothetical protein